MKKPNNLGLCFHLYHASWLLFLIALFVFFDFWIALLIIGALGAYFVRNL
jgi:hypothetical protein